MPRAQRGVSPVINNLGAMLLLELGRPSDAVVLMREQFAAQEAAGLTGERLGMYKMNLALAYEWAGELEEAERLFREMVADGAGGGEAMLQTNAGGCLLATGKVEEAAPLLESSAAAHLATLQGFLAQYGLSIGDELPPEDEQPEEAFAMFVEHLWFWVVHSRSYLLSFFRQAEICPAGCIRESRELIKAGGAVHGPENIFQLRLEANLALLVQAQPPLEPGGEGEGTDALREVVRRMRVFHGDNHESVVKFGKMLPEGLVKGF